MEKNTVTEEFDADQITVNAQYSVANDNSLPKPCNSYVEQINFLTEENQRLEVIYKESDREAEFLQNTISRSSIEEIEQKTEEYTKLFDRVKMLIIGAVGGGAVTAIGSSANDVIDIVYKAGKAGEDVLAHVPDVIAAHSNLLVVAACGVTACIGMEIWFRHFVKGIKGNEAREYVAKSNLPARVKKLVAKEQIKDTKNIKKMMEENNKNKRKAEEFLKNQQEDMTNGR